MAERMLSTESKIVNMEFIKKNIALCLKDVPVVKAILFGSYAKGTQDDISDIDIVIDSKGRLKGFKFFGLLEKLSTSLGKTVDLIEISEIDRDSEMYNTIIREGVVVYESAHEEMP